MNTLRLRWFAVAGLAAATAALAGVLVVQAGGESQIAKIRSSSAAFHRTEAAQAEGWDLRQGLDQCFDKPGTGGMGFHYINLEELNDLSEDVLRPEALVYAPAPNGRRDLAAVEYIVPAAPWAAAGNTAPPTVLGHDLHLDPDLGVYELHAWVFTNNPAGMFEDFNPKASLCPSS